MKTYLSLLFICVFTIQTYSQRELDSLTYEQTQDINFFKNIKNRTSIQVYTTVNRNVVKVGDTVILGKPTSMETSTRSNTIAAGSNLRGARTSSRSVSKKTYEFIKLGRPAGFGSIMNAMSGEAANMASNSLSNTKAIVKEIKAHHRGSKKKPLYLIMVLGELNGKAFGINKYLSVMNTELAIEQGEIYLLNRKMTRSEAIAKLKESKELFDLEIMTKVEYSKIKKELTPIIMGKKK